MAYPEPLPLSGDMALALWETGSLEKFWLDWLNGVVDAHPAYVKAVIACVERLNREEMPRL